MRRRPRAGRAPSDEGSLALELTIVAPVLLALIALLLSFGRQAQVTGLLESTARDGARAATQSRSRGDAQQRLDDIVRDTMGQAAQSCRDSAEGDILPGPFAPGERVTVEVRCRVTFSDLGLVGVPGSREVARRFTSPLDIYRGVDES